MDRRIILMEEESRSPKRISWLPEWISPYESPWSIFEKFKYANRATVMDLFELFGTSYSKGLKATHLSQKACNLITLEGLDESLLKDAFGLSLKEVNRRNINMLTNILPEGSSKLYFHSRLRLCPECIKIGYHSIFHQFSLLSRCPFHNLSLVEGCPKCDREIYYRLSDQNTKEPFRCKCGHLLFFLKKGQRYPTAWKTMNLENQSKPLKYWILFNLGNVHERIFLYFRHDVSVLKKDELMEFILEALAPSYEMNPSALHRKVKSSTYIRDLPQLEQTQPIHTIGNHDEIQFKKEIYQSSKATIKSIVSHVRKVFHVHTKCINNFHRNVYKENNICSFAFAFLSWRKFNEGNNSIYDVKQRKKEIPFFNSLEYLFAIEQDHRHLNDLLFKLRTHYHIHNLTAIKWIINRVMGHLSLNHLKNWLRIAPLHASNNTVFFTVPFNSEHLPFYLILIPKNKNAALEFHWWYGNDMLQLKDIKEMHLNCPVS